MFKQNFINICIERNVAPTTVLRQIGLSNATFSCWTDDSVPRKTTLTKIADYFGITPEELLRDPAENVPTSAEPAPTSPLSAEFCVLFEQLTVKDAGEILQIMKEKLKNKNKE